MSICDLNHRLATFERSFGRSSRVSPLNPNHRQSPIPPVEPSFGRKYRFRTIRCPRVHSGRSPQSVRYLPRSSPFSVVSKKMRVGGAFRPQWRGWPRSSVFEFRFSWFSVQPSDQCARLVALERNQQPVLLQTEAESRLRRPQGQSVLYQTAGTRSTWLTRKRRAFLVPPR